MRVPPLFLKHALGIITLVSFIFFLLIPGLSASDPIPKNDLEIVLKGKKIPNDIDELLGLLQPGKAQDIAGLYFAHSRSLQSAHTTPDQPRLVAGLPLRNGNPETFIGYAPGGKQVEVLTWNEERGKYDFLVIEKFERGQTPVLRTAAPETCIKCHQHGGPILTPFPWAETNISIRQTVQFSKRVKAEFGSNIDGMVRAASSRLNNIEACGKICLVGDDECWRALVTASALLQRRNLLRSTDDLSPLLPREVIRILSKRMSGRNFAVISNILNDRVVSAVNPAESKTSLQGISTKDRLIQDKLPKGPNGATPFKDNAVSFDASTGMLKFIELPIEEFQSGGVVSTVGTKVGDFSNPATPREWESQITSQLSADFFLERLANECFRFPDAFLDKIAKIPTAEITKKILSSNLSIRKRTDRMLPPEFFQRVFGVLPEINAICEPADTTSPLSGSTITQVTQILPALEGFTDKTPLTADENKKATQLFSKYCAECHQSGKFMDLGLKNWENLQSFKDYKVSNGKALINRLIDIDMPPHGTTLPTTEERSLMIRAIR